MKNLRWVAIMKDVIIEFIASLILVLFFLATVACVLVGVGGIFFLYYIVLVTYPVITLIMTAVVAIAFASTSDVIRDIKEGKYSKENWK